MSEQRDEIRTRTEPDKVYAWRGSDKGGTLQGTLRLDITGTEAKIGEFRPADAARGAGLVIDLLTFALAEVPSVTSVDTDGHLVGARGIERLYRANPGVSFT